VLDARYSSTSITVYMREWIYVWKRTSASTECIKKPEAIKCCPWAISALKSHAFPHACRQLWKSDTHLLSFISFHPARKRYLIADRHGVQSLIIFNTVSGYNKRTIKTGGNKEQYPRAASETGLNLNVYTVSIPQFTLVSKQRKPAMKGR
jgi:hypothetical protein